MYIEDLITNLAWGGIFVQSYDSALVNSFSDQVSRGSGLTEKQSVLAIRILKRYSGPLSAKLRTDVTPFLQNPVFRFSIRKISSEKSLSVVDHSHFGRAIKAVFPYNEKIVESIRKARDEIGQAVWDKDEKCWFFTISEASLQFLLNLEGFDTDDLIKEFQSQIKEIHSDIEKYVPMLIIEDSVPKLKNCDKNMPVLASNDLLSAVFDARNKGVYTWDETINNFINSDELDPLTRSFLKTEPGEKFGVNSEIHDISALSTIILHLAPVLVIVPGGDELTKMQLATKFFRDLDFKNEDMSVMFRLPSNTQATFNEFVKFNELNSPIHENTKVVFVSQKIPKPIFKSGIKFNCVLNLGYSNVHYTMRDFVKNHENGIMYSREKEIKNLKYGFL